MEILKFVAFVLLSIFLIFSGFVGLTGVAFVPPVVLNLLEVAAGIFILATLGYSWHCCACKTCNDKKE